MLSLVILFTGTAVTILVKEASCMPELDLESILKVLLQQQQQPEIPQQLKLKTEEFLQEKQSSDDQSDDDNSYYGSLNKQEVLKLIQLAQQDKENIDENYSNEHVDLNIKQKSENINNNRLNRGLENEHDSGDSIDQVLLQLLSQAVQHSNPGKQPKSARSELPLKQHPNTLTSTNTNEKSIAKNQDIGDLNDYSKIYIVLNPQTIKKSKNANTLNDLVSKVLSLSSSSPQKQRQNSNKQQNYKGFPIKGNLFSRRRRDSNEVYAPKGSMEDGYKPKRSRNDHGGGNAGRTAIPYIKHRGDIYERDH